MLDKAPKLSQAVQSFLILCEARNLSPPTLEWYSDRLRMALRYLGDRPVDEITTADLTELVLYLSKRHAVRMTKRIGLSPSTVNGHIRAIKAAFRYLLEEGLIEHDPSRKLRQLKTTKDSGAALTADELKAMIRHNKGSSFHAKRNLAMLLLFTDT